MKHSLTLAYLMTAHLEPEEVLPLAQEAGYAGIGIRLAPLTLGGHFSPLSKDAAAIRRTKAQIRATGVTIFDVEGVRFDSQYRCGSFDRELEVSAELGARAITVIGDDADETRLIDSFEVLCAKAAAYDLIVALEYIPYTHVPDARSALRIAEQVEHRNARVAVDALHTFRSHTTNSDLRTIPSARISHVQICDALAEAPATREGLMHEARAARMLPGCGSIDLETFLRVFPAEVPLSVEAPNIDQTGAIGRMGWLRQAFEASQKVLNNVRSKG